MKEEKEEKSLFENDTKSDSKQPEKKKKQEIVLTSTQKLVFAAKNAFEKGNDYQLNFNQEANFAVQALEANPYLAGCTPESIKNAIVNVSLTGITLNPALKFAYLVPRQVKNERICVLDISYMGMIKILTDAGAIKSVDANVVYENDVFSYSQGTNPYLEHQRTLKDRGEALGAYAIAYFRDGGSQFVIMDKSEIEAVRATSESWKNEKGRAYSPWAKWEDEMWKKTALKRLFKLLPKTNFSDNLIAALANEHQNDIQDTAKDDRFENDFTDVFDDAEIVD